jgi:hypothetical protein
MPAVGPKTEVISGLRHFRFAIENRHSSERAARPKKGQQRTRQNSFGRFSKQAICTKGIVSPRQPDIDLIEVVSQVQSTWGWTDTLSAHTETDAKSPARAPL